MGGFGIAVLIVVIAAIFMRTVGKDNPQLKQWAIFVQAIAGILVLICLASGIIIGYQQGQQRSLQEKIDVHKAANGY